MNISNYIPQLVVAIFLGLFLGGMQPAVAQQGKVYVSNNPDGPGISVRWAGKEVSYQEGIRIYRRQGRGNWVLITANPILPPTSIPTDIELSKNAQGIMDMFLKTDHQEFVEGFGGILTLMQSLKDYPLALALRIAYNDLNAEKGKKYSYKVEAILNGETVLLGESEEIKCTDYSPLPAPTGFSFERKKRRTGVWWANDSLHYSAYNFYVKAEGEPEFTLHTREMGSEVIGAKTTHFIDLKTHKDTTYILKLQALDYFGGQSEWSEELRVVVQDFDPPTTPEILVKANSGASTNTLTWQRPPESDLAGYDLYRLLEEVDTVYTKLNRSPLSPKDTSYVDRVKRPGAYTYQLVALDETGNEAKSLAETGEIKDITPPPVPQHVAVFPDTGVFVIRWQPVKADDLRGYVVYRSLADEDNSDNKYMPASEVLDSNYFAEPMAKNMSAPFVYVVRSVDSLFNNSDNSEAVIGQLPDVTPPVKPMIKSVEAEEGKLRIVWVRNVERDLKGYHIYKRLEGDTTDFKRLNLSMVPKDISAYTDKSVERGQAYEYYVEAVDFSDLVSPASNVGKGKLPHLELAGQIEISRQKFVPARSEFNLSWNGNQLQNEPVVGYAVYRSLDGTKALQRGKVSLETQFKEKLTRPGKYEYHIRAYGERGNIMYSDSVTIEVEKE